MRAFAVSRRVHVLTAGLLITAAFAAVPVTQAEAAHLARTTGTAAVTAEALAGNGVFDDVVATSIKNAWAVGHYGGLGNPKSLIEHWNGRKWLRVAAGPVHAWLNGVAATSARDVWVTGLVGNKALILHFNGKTWRTFYPMHGKGSSLLVDVTAVSPRDAWAVGGTGTASLAEHWNGKTWRRVPSPSPGDGGAVLTGVSALSATNIWAVGGLGGSVTLHWNGTAWRHVTSPSPARGAALQSVAAISAHEVWVVGETASGTLILRWNGNRWRRAAAPAIGSGAGLLGVSGASARSAWAVGTTGGLVATGAGTAAAPALITGAAGTARFGAAAAGTPEPVILHWNGRSWQQVSAPIPAHGGQLIGAFSGPRGMTWVVGCTRTFGDRNNRPLVQRITGARS